MIKKHMSTADIVLTVLLLLMLISAGYFGYQTLTLKESLTTLAAKNQLTISEKDALLAQADIIITDLTTELDDTKEELDDLEDDYRKEKNKNDDFEDQIRDISKTVGSLDKLSKTDEELLQKYSKVYFLNENYVPSDIEKIDKKYILDGREQQFFHGNAIPFLEKMLDRAKRDDIDLQVLSAYRSFDAQTHLKGQYTQTYGTGANAFSADQGYSEHQLGTTIDLTDTETGGPYTSFENTDAYKWLQKNAYRYGFTLSYPKDNGFYVFEPWHWRFVGEDLAEHLHDERIHFYDMDQREIDTYLIKIFD